MEIHSSWQDDYLHGSEIHAVTALSYWLLQGGFAW